MNVLLVDNGTSYLPQLKALIPAGRLTTVPFEELSAHKFDDYDLIILSGGHKYALMSHRRKYARELSLIAATTKPIIGICLGFELIVVAFGGTLKLLRHKVHQEVTIELSDGNPLGGKRQQYQVFESHRRSVKRLPAALTPIGRSVNGVEIIKHQNRPIYAFQFHPEMSSAQEGGLLIAHALQRLEVERS